MLRSRLKNIINKSKEISNKKQVGDPFDEFKKSLPKEIEIGDNYRLEAAWKAYGSPKNYREALWGGFIQPIDENTFKLPSIGYNGETDEYEYLNKGRENETVLKDIRVWDNDVIPFVKELKHGGYVRTFNEEKDCWTYSKNSQKRIESSENQELQVNLFLKGGKTSFKEWYSKLPEDKNKTEYYDLERAYNELPIEELEAFRTIPEKHLDGRFKKSNHPTYDENQDPEYQGRYGWFGSNETGWEFRPSPRLMLLIEEVIKSGKGQVMEALLARKEKDINPVVWYKEYWDLNEPESTLIIGERGKPAAWLYSRILPNEVLRRHFIKPELNDTQLTNSLYTQKPPIFKEGGQMSVIPEGALHARKNEMELAKEGTVTHKGIPVIDNEGEQQAEIERNEIIFRKEVTDKMEELYKKYKSENTSQSEKDDIAIKMGKIITCEITKHTDDKTGLIELILEGM